MSKKYLPGKHFLQLPGPSNVPDRILRAMDYPTIDHRGPEFSDLANDCLEGIKTIFKTKSNVIIYPASGTGAWEAALVNTIRENELVLMVETGHFASLWNKMALRLGIRTEFLETDWRRGVVPEKLLDRYFWTIVDKAPQHVPNNAIKATSWIDWFSGEKTNKIDKKPIIKTSHLPFDCFSLKIKYAKILIILGLK